MTKKTFPLIVAAFLILIPTVGIADEEMITHPKDVLIEGDLIVNNIRASGTKSTTGYRGDSSGDKKESFSLSCPNQGVVVGLDVKRFFKDDGDKDRYQFQLVCR